MKRTMRPSEWHQHMQQPFDTRLPADVLNIDRKTRSNLFPWRGQFSPQLVEALLTAYAHPESVVLDPFMGSGTTLVECARLGLAAHGYEINPAAFTIAKLYEFCNVDATIRHEAIAAANHILAKALPDEFDLPLFSWQSSQTTNRATSLFALALQASQLEARWLLEALLVLANENAQEDANSSYRAKWNMITKIILALPRSTLRVSAHLGDARRLTLPDGSVDFVLSSPPYINVFNYHHNYRAAVERLGWKPLVVARSEIGSNRKFRQNRFLTVVQYCIDMALALRELRRACIESAKIILILGRESNVHKTPFFNGSIVTTLARDICHFDLVLKQERVFSNRFGQAIREDILHLRPSSKSAPDREVTVASAREIGMQILLEAMDRVPSDRRHYLENAVARAPHVTPSPILDTTRAIAQDHSG